MYKYIIVFSNKIPTYTICNVVGILASIFVAERLLFERLLLRKYIKILMLSSVGLIVFARLFGIISRYLYDLYMNGTADLMTSIKTSGIVYLGGLIGYLLNFIILCKFKKYDIKEAANIIAVIIPLFHMFGRIGCYFAGCCYGVESTGWLAIPYKIDAESEILYRVPTQLLEALFEAELFIFNLAIYRKKYRQKKAADGEILRMYLYMYCLFRFVLEFLRGDEIRGVFWGISFSQIISCLIVITLIIYSRKGEKEW